MRFQGTFSPEDLQGWGICGLLSSPSVDRAPIFCEEAGLFGLRKEPTPMETDGQGVRG